jgi:hypothetical protein
VLKIVALARRAEAWTYASLATSLRMSASEVHACVSRAKCSRLIGDDPWVSGSIQRPSPRFNHIVRFVTNGLRYVLPVEKGAPTRGMSTSIGAEPLKNLLLVEGTLCPVWPGKLGSTQGYAFKPVYRSCPQAARADDDLYQLLSLADALRDPDAKPREQQLAASEFAFRCQASRSLESVISQ